VYNKASLSNRCHISWDRQDLPLLLLVAHFKLQRFLRFGLQFDYFANLGKHLHNRKLLCSLNFLDELLYKLLGASILQGY